MIEEIAGASGAVTALKKLYDSFNESAADKKAKAIAIELNNVIFSLQQSLFALQAKNETMLKTERDLKEKCMALEIAMEKLANYELSEIATGVFVYSLKPSVEPAQPLHHVCANCYSSGKASILQVNHHTNGGARYRCQSCGNKLDVTGQPRKTYNPLDRH